jgi:hypothetical protein
VGHSTSQIRQSRFLCQAEAGSSGFGRISSRLVPANSACCVTESRRVSNPLTGIGRDFVLSLPRYRRRSCGKRSSRFDPSRALIADRTVLRETCRADDAELLHSVNQRRSLHSQSRSRTIASTNDPVTRANRPEDVVSIHFLEARRGMLACEDTRSGSNSEVGTRNTDYGKRIATSQ